MISFLSREKSNSSVLIALKRSAEERKESKRIKMTVSLGTTNVKEVAQTELKLPEEKNIPVKSKLNCLPPVLSKDVNFVAEEIIAEFKMRNTDFDWQSCSPPESIPSQVHVVVNRLVYDNELRGKHKISNSTFRFNGRVKKPHLSWKQRATIIFFHLHPKFANKDLELTSYVRWIKV
jgi:hypothetical protein